MPCPIPFPPISVWVSGVVTTCCNGKAPFKLAYKKRKMAPCRPSCHPSLSYHPSCCPSLSCHLFSYILLHFFLVAPLRLLGFLLRAVLALLDTFRSGWTWTVHALCHSVMDHSGVCRRSTGIWGSSILQNNNTISEACGGGEGRKTEVFIGTTSALGTGGELGSELVRANSRFFWWVDSCRTGV